MQVIYRHGFNNNLMIIRDNNILINDYRINMIMRNKISGLLEMYIGCVNGESELSYIISSRQSIRDLFIRNKMKYEDVKKLLDGIISLGKELREYLLDINKIILDLDYIYFDVDTKNVYFCYYPNNDNAFDKSFRSMVQDIMALVEHSDYKAVELTYGIMEVCSRANFSLKQIEQYMKESAENIRYKESEKYNNNNENFNYMYSYANKTDENTKYDKNGINDRYKNDNFNYINKQINDMDEVSSIVSEDSNYSIEDRQNDNGGLIGKFTKLLSNRSLKDIRNTKKDKRSKDKQVYDEDYGLLRETGNYYTESNSVDSVENNSIESNLYENDDFKIPDISDKLGQAKADYNEENINEGETVLISDIIRDKKRKLFSLCDYDDMVINEYPFTIGKANGKVDEIIEDKLVSRIHLRIDNESDKFTIEDLNSRNGTFVNGERLNPYEKVEITVGDKITIASSDYIFK